jgi:hypothetical protein
MSPAAAYLLGVAVAAHLAAAWAARGRVGRWVHLAAAGATLAALAWALVA